MDGHVQVMFDNVPSAAPLAAPGKVPALAVTSTKRTALAPGAEEPQAAGHLPKAGLDPFGGTSEDLARYQAAEIPKWANEVKTITPENLLKELHCAQIGTQLVLPGYPLGFHDTVHHLPVARLAIIASAFGVRFQRQGYFLTDGRAHRGSSGNPVLTKVAAESAEMPWTLLGVHSSRMDMGGRDAVQDESLGLNCAWYADILMTLTPRG